MSMIQFLTTPGITDRLEIIIRDSRERLVIISPYLKVDRRVQELIELKSQSKTYIRIIYGKRPLREEERRWLNPLTSIEICYRPSLHAKCYLNEKEALVTSMNLYEFSLRNNDEWGILVPRKDEWGQSRLYRRIVQEAEHIARLSEKVREVPEPKRFDGLWGLIRHTVGNRIRGSEEVSEEAPPEIPTTGFCLRCKVDLPTNLRQPYCDQHWKVWSRFGNKEYPERYCHFCGNEHKTTLLNPLCDACDSKYKQDLPLAVD